MGYKIGFSSCNKILLHWMALRLMSYSFYGWPTAILLLIPRPVLFPFAETSCCALTFADRTHRRFFALPFVIHLQNFCDFGAAFYLLADVACRCCRWLFCRPSTSCRTC